MKAQTKTFRRFVRKALTKSSSAGPFVQRLIREASGRKKAKGGVHNTIKTMEKIYSSGGKIAVLKHLGLFHMIKQPSSQLPPSMPKSAVDKIAKYDDNRDIGKGIFVVLKKGYAFSGGGFFVTVNNVKEAIAMMRTVKAV